MKNLRAIAVKSLLVFIMFAAVISVVACSGEGSIKGIALDKTQYVLFLDSEKTAVPVVSTDRKHRNYVLQSSNPTIFSVGEGGSITGLKEGIAKLYAISGDKKAEADVLVFASKSSDIIPPEYDGRLLVVFVTEYSAVPSQRVLPGELAEDPGTPPNVPDQVVEGWYLDKDLTQRFDFSTPVTSNLTLYAKWTAGDAPTFTFKTVSSNVYGIDKLKYPNVAFKTLQLPSETSEGKPVTVIYSKAFQDYTAVETVIIPKGITKIMDYAFAGCTNLKTVIFEDGSALTEIMKEAFWKCASLENIVLPSGVTKLGEGAFNECSSLASINLPSGITELPKQVFAKTKLASIDLANITTLRFRAFWDARQLAEIKNPVKLTAVEEQVFAGTRWLTDAYAPDGAAYLGTVLIHCNKTAFNEIVVRRGTTLIAESALSHLDNFIINLTEITDEASIPARYSGATNIIENGSSEVHKNKVNIIVPKELVSAYKNHKDWKVCNNQIYYKTSVTVGGDTVEFLVRALGDKTCVVIYKYTGFGAELNIAEMMKSSQDIGELAYLENIRAKTFISSGGNANAVNLKRVILPLRTAYIESSAFDVALEAVYFAGYSDSADGLNTIRLQTSSAFRPDTKIYLPKNDKYYDYKSAKGDYPPIWSNLENRLRYYYNIDDVTYASKIVLPDALTAAPEVVGQEGKVLDGWYKSANYAEKFDFSTPITGNITLYAKWVDQHNNIAAYSGFNRA